MPNEDSPDEKGFETYSIDVKEMDGLVNEIAKRTSSYECFQAPM